MKTSVRLVAAWCCVFGWLAAVPGIEAAPSAADIIEFRVPAPPSVGVREVEVGLEMNAPSGWANFIKAEDGRTMMIGNGVIRTTSDKGRTWSDPEKMSVSVGFVVRLQSGALGGVSGSRFYVSADEGKTWEERGDYAGARGPASGASPYVNTLIQTRAGRILLPVRWCGGAGHGGLYDKSMSWGMLNGKLTPVEGHAHYPEPDNGFVIYSDDEGRTWQRSEGGIMIWHKEGYGGMWPCDEPSLIEARNGDVFLFMRTTLGRLYSARSTVTDYVNHAGKRLQHTPGQRFQHPQPTALACSYSPPTMARVPDTGDWLVIFNQISGDELRASYRRGRLSSAISSDDGRTWKHFRTLDTSVLPPMGRVEPDPEPQMARGLDYVGVLPADYGGVSYATVDVVDDTVFAIWSRSVVRPRPGDVTGRRLRILPLSWFYEEEPPLPPAAKLILRVSAHDARNTMNSYEIPAVVHDGRFFCRLSDLAVYLKSPAGRLGYDIFAPVHQVVTCLGWVPTYDRGMMEDPENPRMIVTCTHPQAGDAPRVTAAADDDQEEVPGLIRVSPVAGIPVNLFNVPVGTQKTLEFDWPFPVTALKQAWLEMFVDDIDVPKEAKITLNDEIAVTAAGAVLGEGTGHFGRLELPVAALKQGRNRILFEFADNLNGTTAGYIIEEAALVLALE